MNDLGTGVLKRWMNTHLPLSIPPIPPQQQMALMSLTRFLQLRTGRIPRVVTGNATSSDQRQLQWRALAAAKDPSGAGALCPIHKPNGPAEGEEAEEERVVLELDDFSDQALVEALMARMLRGEEELTTEDGVAVRALVCSMATTTGTTTLDALDDDAAALDDDKGVAADEPMIPTNDSSSNGPIPRARRPGAVSVPVAGGIAAAVLGTIIFAVLVGLRGQLRRCWLARPGRTQGMKVSQAGANTVATVPASPPSY